MNTIDLSLLQNLILAPNPEPTIPNPQPPIPNPQKNLRVWKEKQKGGRVATCIKNFENATDQDLTDLAKTLKNKFATGGVAKNNEIILQGDLRDKTIAFLKELGHAAKSAG